VQVSGALIGFALGAAVGPGTLLVALFVGPLVAWMQGTLFRRHGCTNAGAPMPPHHQ
jgi:uncharacterized membrane protein YczE